MKSMAVTMPVMPPFAPIRRAASLLALAKSLHTSVTVLSSGAVTGGCGQAGTNNNRKRRHTRHVIAYQIFGEREVGFIKDSPHDNTKPQPQNGGKKKGHR